MALIMQKAVTRRRNSVTYEAAGSANGDILFTLNDRECDEFDSYIFLSSIGAVTVEITLNGTDWSNPVALQDMAGTLIDQNAATTQLNLFGLILRPAGLRVKASGGAAQCAMTAWATGRKS